MELSQVTFWLFTAFSGMRLFSYLPQIRRVAIDANGASAISYSTWALWTGANIATALYAIVNLNDPYLASVSVLYASCCVAVLVLTALKRRRISLVAAPAARGPSRAEMAAGRRQALMHALQARVREGAERIAGGCMDAQLERELSRHCRRIVCHDLANAIAGRFTRR